MNIAQSLMRTYRRRIDPYLLLAGGLLVLLGSLAVFSATEFPDSTRAGFFARHLVALPLGLTVMLLMMLIPLRALEDLAWILYGGAVLMLIAVLLVGIEVYGARRWLGHGALRIQPSEIAKLITCCALARYFVGGRRDLSRVSTLAAAAGIALLPMLLVLREPDLGTSGAFAFMALGMVFWAGLPWLHLFLLTSGGFSLLLCRLPVLFGVYLIGSSLVLWKVRVSWLLLAVFVVVQLLVFLGAPAIYNHLEPYQQMRLKTFQNPELDPAGGGYQILQSKIAIGSGGFWGKGPLKGSQKALAFLPQQHTDFIFSVVGEEAGFVGCGITVVLFVLLITRGFHLGLHCRNAFSGLLATGIACLFLYHAGVNIAMTVGLLPVTGLPLPFVSYGGSFLLSSFAMLGLLFNISAHRFDY